MTVLSHEQDGSIGRPDIDREVRVAPLDNAVAPTASYIIFSWWRFS